MKRILILSVFTILSLAGCGNPWATNQGGSKARLAAAFVEAADGTLYSVPCLQARGADIAAGVKDAGRECAADKLDQDQVRGMRGYYGNSAYFYTVNPQNYYGGQTYTYNTQYGAYSSPSSNAFCQTYFNYSWGGGCFSWLGYKPVSFNTKTYYPECSSCIQSTTYNQYGVPDSMYPTVNGCPSYCSAVSTWTQQPWYQNWNSWSWVNTYY